MSVIGPRPLLVEYLPYYTKEEHHRHDVRPGLSGWAQINGRNAIDSWEQRFQYDLEYVKNVSFACQRILHPARIRVFYRAVPAVEWTGGNPPFPDVRSGRG